MKMTPALSLLSIPLLLLAGSGHTAQQQAVPLTVTEPAAAATAPQTATPVESMAEAATADKAVADTATADASPATAAPAPVATATSLSADEIARRPPSEWDALIDQRERELDQLRQSSYPSWPSPYSGWIDARSRQLEDQMQARMQQLQRRIDFDQNRFLSPWDRASSNWWDFQRSQSRLQSLRTREYLDRMTRQGSMRGYPRYRRW